MDVDLDDDVILLVPDDDFMEEDFYPDTATGILKKYLPFDNVKPLVSKRIPRKMLGGIRFKRRLILQVRQYREIYDNVDDKFSDQAAKDIAWMKIAQNLKTNVDICKNNWVDLRFEYQRYVRRLRKFLRSGNKNNHRRPNMALEEELLFLWRFVADRNTTTCSLPYDDDKVGKTNALECDDDVVMVVEDPIEIIDVDAEDMLKSKERKTPHAVFIASPEVCQLIEAIKEYPELYVVGHRYFNDYKRRGIIWNAIANELNDKATKLMKFWIQLQTRYECDLNAWRADKSKEIDNRNKKLELLYLMDFLEPYIDENPNTIFKQSFYLRLGWIEPIDHFKNIFSLLTSMKKYPQIVPLTDKLLKSKEKESTYFVLWTDIANFKGFTSGQCEITWLILRSFYWELMNMRKHSYQLQDKWYFESIISELYNYAENLSAALEKSTATRAPFVKIAPKPPALTTPALTPTLTAVPPVPVPVPPVSVSKPLTISNVVEKRLAPTKDKKILPVQITNRTGELNKLLSLPRISSAKSLVPPYSSVNMDTNKNNTIKVINSIPLTKPSLVQSSSASITSTIPKSSYTSNGVTNSSNLPFVQLPYQLPERTKVTAYLPKTTPNNINKALPTIITNATVDLTNCDDAPLPQISSAMSLLNPNEIMIELISASNGNQLVVHGPPLEEKYSLSMAKTASFIREVMAIPLLHSKNHNQPAQVNFYWQYLSMKFKIPIHICKACWTFLSENFEHFPQIAPMKELMRPFEVDLKVWKESPDLFTKFDINAVQMGWTKYIKDLPQLMQIIGEHPTLHKDYAKFNKDSVPVYNDMHVTMIWRTIRTQFAHIPSILDIWMAFRNVFWYYMNDLELGIDNKWPLRWWRVLAKLKYLVNYRYNDLEPFYYIVRNKVTEELERCNLAEIKESAAKKDSTPNLAINGLSMQQMTFEDGVVNYNFNINSDEPTITATTSNLPQTTIAPLEVANDNLNMPTVKQETPPTTSNLCEALIVPEEVTPDNFDDIISLENQIPATAILRRTSTAPLEILNPDLRTIPKLQTRSSIDAYTLFAAIQRHPKIYENCDAVMKVLAWENVANELDTTVSTARLTFQRALKNYFTFVARDPANRCRINHRYYKNFKEIYRIVKPQHNKINIKTPTELNQSIETVFPERFIIDINMENNQPALVAKNWSYAIGCFTLATQRNLESDLNQLFEKYRPYAL